MLKMKKTFTICAALSVCFCIALASIFYKNKGDAQEYRLESYASEVADLAQTSLPQKLEAEIFKAVNEGRITPEDFDRLDFTFPENDGFGDNVEYEVFNVSSPRSLLNGAIYKFPLFEQSYLDTLTVKPGVKPFFSIRQYACRGDDICQSIVLVFPHIDLSKCALEKESGWSLSVVQAPSDMQFKSDLNSAAQDADAFFNVCLKDKYNDGYLMLPVVQRFRKKDEPTWQVKFRYNYAHPVKVEK